MVPGPDIWNWLLNIGDVLAGVTPSKDSLAFEHRRSTGLLTFVLGILIVVGVTLTGSFVSLPLWGLLALLLIGILLMGGGGLLYYFGDRDAAKFQKLEEERRRRRNGLLAEGKRTMSDREPDSFDYEDDDMKFSASMESGTTSSPRTSESPEVLTTADSNDETDSGTISEIEEIEEYES